MTEQKTPTLPNLLRAIANIVEEEPPTTPFLLLSKEEDKIGFYLAIWPKEMEETWSNIKLIE